MNVLASYFSCPTDFGVVLDQADLRAQGLLAVAVYDFDISVIMPPNSQHLPWKFGTEGLLLYRPRDLHQGAYEYNPYAFDVACMGNLLLTMFHVCVSLPFCYASSSPFTVEYGSTCADACPIAGRNDFARPLCSLHCP